MAKTSKGKMGRDKVGKKPKAKSVKAKTSNMSSKRRLSRFGKEQGRGLSGHAAMFMTRARALRHLQVTLRDFRRLCILKGIFPREPVKSPKGKDKTYYHIKDISFLAHEPLLAKFREFKAFMNKVRKRLAKKEHSAANKMYDQRPQYTLDHLVRERYPRFTDAIADMDDALCLVHLFASLPAEKSIRTERTEACLRLAREWQLYVVKSRSLRKVFVSIKGFYYQADVDGQPVTWLVPHKFSQDLPTDVDYRVMLTFLEFYETALGFIMFRLYSQLGLRYPPKIDEAKAGEGEHLSSLELEPTSEAIHALKDVEGGEEGEESGGESDGGERDGDDEESTAATDATATKASAAQLRRSEKRLATLGDRIRSIGSGVEEEETTEGGVIEGAVDAEAIDDEDEAIDDAFTNDEGVVAVMEQERVHEAMRSLFGKLRFFVSREVPMEPVEFAVGSFGGTITNKSARQAKAAGEGPTNAGDTDASKASATHVITDRPVGADFVPQPGTEYVQPQWIFDCINNRKWMLLPVERYAPDSKDLPPHLSPFVDNEAEGYQPTYAAEIESLRKLRTAANAKDAGSIHGASGVVAKVRQASKDDGLEDEESQSERAYDSEPSSVPREESEPEDEEEYNASIKRELAGEDQMEADDGASGEEESEEEESDEEADGGNVADSSDAAAAKRKRTRTGNEAPDPETLDKPARFLPAPRFKGARKGFIFKSGKFGVGYYIDEPAKITFRRSKGPALSKRQQRKKQAEEEHKMRTMMMSKKSKRLYGRMQHGIKQKKDKVEALKRKRDEAASLKKGAASLKKGGKDKRRKR